MWRGPSYCGCGHQVGSHPLHACSLHDCGSKVETKELVDTCLRVSGTHNDVIYKIRITSSLSADLWMEWMRLNFSVLKPSPLIWIYQKTFHLIWRQNVPRSLMCWILNPLEYVPFVSTPRCHQCCSCQIPFTRVGILILATPRYIGYKCWWSNAPMQQEGRILPLHTYIMEGVHHETGIRSSQLIVSRCRDSA